MPEKKDPHQENRPVDFDDDDDIIDLTDEVSTESQSDDEIIDLPGSGTAVHQQPAEIPKQTDKNDPESDDENDIIYLDGTPETESQTAEGFIDLDVEVGDDESTFGEDDMIASAVVESLDTDDDDLQENRLRLIDDSDTTTEQDDDIIILSEEDEDPAAVSNRGGPITEKDEEIFDNEEEIKLEYEGEEDEYDLLAMSDMENIEELETITMDDQDPDASVDEDISFDPGDSLVLSSDENNEIITMDDDSQKEPDLVAFNDEETLGFEESGDLTDLSDELVLEFDGEEDQDGIAAADDHITEDSADTIAGAIEKSRTPEEVSAQIEGAMVPKFEFPEDGDITAEDEEKEAPEDLAAQTLEEIRELAEEDALPDMDEDMDLEFDDDESKSGVDDVNDLDPEDEIIPFEVLDDSAVEEEDDIIEITEFDEHFPEENEKLFESTGVLDASDPADDDFLELIEVEEEDPDDDEEVVEFSHSDELVTEDEIDNFFSETLEDEPVFENDEIEPAEKTGTFSTDTAVAAAQKTDENEEFDFRFGSSGISDKVDRLNSFLSEDASPDPKIGEDVRSVVEETPESWPATPDQIDAILERVIQDKFGKKIETIIYEVIEKVVSKEISRLKGALLDSSGPGDDE